MVIEKIKDGAMLGISPELITTTYKEDDDNSRSYRREKKDIKTSNKYYRVVGKVTEFEPDVTFMSMDWSTIFGKELKFSKTTKEGVREFDSIAIKSSDSNYCFRYYQIGNRGGERKNHYYSSDWYNDETKKVDDGWDRTTNARRTKDREYVAGEKFIKFIKDGMEEKGDILGRSYYVSVECDGKGEIEHREYGENTVFLIECSTVDSLKKVRKNNNDMDNVRLLGHVNFYSTRSDCRDVKGYAAYACEDTIELTKEYIKSVDAKSRGSYYSYNSRYCWEYVLYVFVKKKAASATKRKRKRKSKLATTSLKNAKDTLAFTHSTIKDLEQQLEDAKKSIPGKEKNIEILEKMIASTNKGELLLFMNNKKHRYHDVAKDLFSCYLFNDE